MISHHKRSIICAHDPWNTHARMCEYASMQNFILLERNQVFNDVFLMP